MRTSAFLIVTLMGSVSPCLAGGANWGGDIPQALKDHLQTLADNNVDISSVCWDGLQSWFCVTDKETRSGGPLPDSMTGYISGLQTNGAGVRSVFFNTSGTWFVIGKNGSTRWEGTAPPTAANDYMQGAINAGASIQTVSYLPNGGWAVVTSRGAYDCIHVPKAMIASIHQARDNGKKITSICLATNGGWIISYK